MQLKRAYTIVELITTCALSVALMALSAAAYHMWIHRTSIESSAENVAAFLRRARALALAENREVRVVFCLDESDKKSYFGERHFSEDENAAEIWQRFTQTNFLPRLIEFSGAQTPSGIVFDAAGKARIDGEKYDASAEIRVALESTDGAQAAEIFVAPRTGFARCK